MGGCPNFMQVVKRTYVVTLQAEERNLGRDTEGDTHKIGDETRKSGFLIQHPTSLSPFEKRKQVFGQAAFLTVSLVNLQNPVLADKADPSIRSTLLHHGLDLSQYLPEFPETRLSPSLDRHQVVLSDLTLCDREEHAGAVNGEVMNRCLGEVQLGIRIAPIEVGGGDL